MAMAREAGASPSSVPAPISLAETRKSYPPVARLAQRKRRHWGLWCSFLLVVIVPLAASTGYLLAYAADRYVSRVGFAVRAVQPVQSLDLLSGLIGSGGSTSGDTAMVYAYLQSQDLVQSLDEKLDLRRLFSRSYGQDPVFSLAPDAPLEDLLRYWNRMIGLTYDSATGLIELQVTAFSPRAAQRIARTAFDEAAQMVNALSTSAEQEMTASARRERDASSMRLAAARRALRVFRAHQQILDPGADATGRLGLLNALQDQLAQSLIELDLLRQTTRQEDPRLYTTEHKIAALRARIAEEKAHFGGGETDGPSGSYADMMEEYERLSSNQEFAEKAYLAALAAFDAAQQQARQQSLYLAAYQPPTLAQSARYPDRPLLIAMTAGFALLVWAALALIYYSLRDRR
ncbi:sugar transporter [Thioclava sp. BHET1]|nr:sugar transporter [Thioclava sp. BHET1]